MPFWTRIPRWIDGFWLALLAAYILAGAVLAPFHGDESTQIFMGRDYHYLLVEGDLDKVYFDSEWRESPQEQHLRIVNGTVTKSIFGWQSAMAGLSPDGMNSAWDWSRDYDSNLAAGAMPSRDSLMIARVSSALQLALAAALLFVFARQTLNAPTAYLASAFFALHPNLLLNGRRAMMEGSHLLGLTLVLLAGLWLLRRRGWRHCVVFGFCAGLAIAAKHPNALVCVLVGLAFALEPLWLLVRDPRREWRGTARTLLGLVLAGAFAIAVFMLLNPAWWRSPLDVAVAAVAERERLLREQVDVFGGYESWEERASGFFRFLFAGERQYYEVDSWGRIDVIDAQIQDYEESGLGGILAFGESTPLGWMSLALCLFALVQMARDKALDAGAKTLILVWALGSACATFLATPLPWSRYYLPLAPAMTLLVAYALTELAGELARRLNRRSHVLALLA